MTTMEFRHAAKPRAHRAILEQVLDRIMSGDVQIGDKLPSEREIAAQSGLSRTSVREAMTVLEDSGLIQRKPGPTGGTVIIADVVPGDLLGKAMELSRRRIVDVLEARSILEPAAAELAAVRADSHEIETLEGIAKEILAFSEGAPDLTELFQTVDPRFHITVARASHNEVLARMNQTLAKEVAVAVDMIPFDEEYRGVEISTATAVVEAIKNRNPMQARIAMSAHITHLPPLVERFFREE